MRDYIKFFIIIVIAVLLSIIGLVSSNLELRIDEDSDDSDVHPVFVRHVKMRCTRRFSPGVCVDNVAPVWTFVFLQQNCSERLGCPNNYRSNRFRSYKMCMKRCRGLVDMYLKMVELEERMADINALNHINGNETDDRNLRGGYDKILPGPGTTKSPTDLVEPTQEDEEEEYKMPDEDTRFVVYKDNGIYEDIRPVDVDSVHGEIRSEVMMEW